MTNDGTRSGARRAVTVLLVVAAIGTGLVALQSCGGSKNNNPPPPPTQNTPPPT